MIDYIWYWVERVYDQGTVEEEEIGWGEKVEEWRGLGMGGGKEWVDKGQGGAQE